MGMGKIKALKIRSIGFLAPDFLHVAFLGFSAKKRLRQKLKVMSEIDRKSTRLNSSHNRESRMPSSA